MQKIIHEREQHHHVPCKLVQTWALEMASKAGLHECSASRGWLVKFLRRTNFSLRRTTTSGQTIPRDFILKVSNFIDYCAEQVQKFDLKPEMIINMDETPMPSARTIESVGAKTVPIKTTGHEKQRITVCLAVRGDGTKLPPFVVISGAKVPKTINYKGVKVVCSKSGWMNDVLTLQWVKEIYDRFSFNKRMLVCDSFKCHINEEVKTIVKKQNSFMAVIPGGCTKFLQPLDVSINKPFKEIFR